MKHLKFYVMALLSLLVGPGMVQAQGNPAMSPGQVEAFIVAGNVTLVHADGTSEPLKRGQTFQEGNVVKAAAGAQALLVFSNGATMKVLENCQLSVDQFQQAAFDDKAEGTFLRLSKDPSKSTTSLDLRNGTLQGEVKQLNQAAGSSFTVKTPAGSAGIRGTIISMSVVRNAAGQVIGITCNCVVGNVAFTPSAAVAKGTTTAAGTTQTVTNTNVDAASVGAGAQLVVTLTVDPTTGVVTGGGVTGSAMATATAQALADAVVSTINTAKATVGIAASPPPTINVTTAPVVTTTTNGVQTTTTAPPITNVTFSTPTPTTQTSGTADVTASPTVTVVTNTPTTTTTSTSTSSGTSTSSQTVNTNPTTVSGN